MCGVLGVAAARGKLDSSWTGRSASAIQTLSHRGPDGQGTYRDETVLFGHTRLSILDLSPAGSQPMRSPDGRFVITYNGEVYNFRELAKEYGLEHLRSGSDTEVVLNLFERLGVEALPKLNGMFAFACYDSATAELWLIRDRLGIKPLYYRLENDRLVFASEIKGILTLDPEGSQCDYRALHEWLYFGNPLGGRTLYRGIRQLPPGHYLRIDLASFACTERAYWSLEERAEDAGNAVGGPGRAILETRRLLEHAVRRQLVSDVPVGVLLSGGVDSSAIAAFASRHYGGRLATYSAGFDFARNGGELPRARRIAARYGTEHHEIHVAGGSVADLIEKLVHQHDMPFSDAANIPLYLIASKIGGHTKVVLQGDGGDELFGGYRRYSALRYRRLLRSAALVLRHLRALCPDSALSHRAQRYLRAFAAPDMAETMALLLTSEDASMGPEAIFAEPIRRQMAPFDPFARHRECRQALAALDVVNQMSLIDLQITLPDTFLEKVDRSTMAAGLEVRVPFLDHELVDFVAALPGRMKVPRGRKKWLLKAALAGIVPAEVLNGPKIGLEVPYGKWLQGVLRPFFFDHLAAFAKHRPGVLDCDYVEQLFARTRAGGRDDSFMLWKVLNFVIWANESRMQFFG